VGQEVSEVQEVLLVLEAESFVLSQNILLVLALLCPLVGLVLLEVQQLLVLLEQLVPLVPQVHQELRLPIWRTMLLQSLCPQHITLVIIMVALFFLISTHMA
jgi:hypothetical protein